jgi:hypothetical protein
MMEVLKAHLVRIFIAQEDILRVQIRVHYILVVEDLNEIYNLKGDIDRVILREESPL